MKPSDYQYRDEEYQPPSHTEVVLSLKNKCMRNKHHFWKNEFDIMNIILNDKYWYDSMKFNSKPAIDDWLNALKPSDRKGQTFKEFYNRTGLRYPSNQRYKIGLVQIGNVQLFPLKYNGKNISFINAMSLIINAYFDMPIKIIKTEDYSYHINYMINNGYLKTYKSSYGTQLLASGGRRGIIDGVLDPIIKHDKNKDLFILMGYTMYDLYKTGFGYLMGGASFEIGAGIFSFVRKLDKNIKNIHSMTPSERLAFFQASWKTLVHEMGHLFGIAHCTWFHCRMNGSTTAFGSTDKQIVGKIPLHFCPSCLQKLHWSRLNKLGVRINKKLKKNVNLKPLNIIDRYNKIADVLEGFGYDASWYRNMHRFLVYSRYGLNEKKLVKWNDSRSLISGYLRNEFKHSFNDLSQMDSSCILSKIYDFFVIR
eukprot:498552_1